ncbi:MAG: hypothetical protein RQ842_09905 [Vulcanisaeta sp.]|nr:hypothetical protein [Vulcanisaeta sp.]
MGLAPIMFTCIPQSQKTDGVCVQDNCPPGYCLTQTVTSPGTPAAGAPIRAPPVQTPVGVVAAATTTTTTTPTQTSGAVSLTIGSILLVAGIGSIIYELGLHKHPVFGRPITYFFRTWRR